MASGTFISSWEAELDSYKSVNIEGLGDVGSINDMIEA